MEKSPLEKVERETALLEKISLAIPGFRGYKLKEMRKVPGVWRGTRWRKHLMNVGEIITGVKL